MSLALSPASRDLMQRWLTEIWAACATHPTRRSMPMPAT